MELKFEPKTEGFSGYLMIAIPSFVEKMTLMKSLGLEIKRVEHEDGKDSFEIDQKNFESIDMLEKLAMIYEVVLPRIKKVDLKYGDKVVNDVEYLKYYDECIPVLSEVFAFLCQGLSLGKS